MAAELVHTPPKMKPSTPVRSRTTSTTTAASTAPAETAMSNWECAFSSRSRMKFRGIASRPETVAIAVNSTASPGPSSARIMVFRSG